MADKQLRQAIINPTQVLVSDGTEVESNLGYFNLGAIGRDLLATATQAEALAAIGAEQGNEIITNANGTAIRFPGIGIQICTWNEAIARTTNINWGFLFRSESITATFPAAFSAPPMVLGAPLSLSVDGGNTGAWIDATNPTTSSVTLMGVSGFNFVVLRLGYFAIGTYTP